MTSKELRKLKNQLLNLSRLEGTKHLTLHQLTAFISAVDSRGLATISSLAAEMDKPTASIVRSIDVWCPEGRGPQKRGLALLERVPDLEDRRSHTLKLTEKGRAFLEEVAK